MATLLPGYAFVAWNGAALALGNAPWKHNVAGIFKVNSSRNAFVSFKPTSQFNNITQLENGAMYLFVIATQFDLDDAALTHAPASPTYNTTLNTATPTTDGMSFAPPASEVLKFNLINGTSGPTVSIAIASLGATCYIDYASEYAGQGYAFINSAGTRFDGTFPASDNLNIAY